MFRGLFKGHNTNDEEDEYFDPVDPIVEQRRKEKFSTPLIYDDFTETKRQTTITKPAIAKETIEVPMQTKKSGYEPMEVISPMRGVSRSKEAAKKECVVKDRQKPKRRLLCLKTMPREPRRFCLWRNCTLKTRTRLTQQKDKVSRPKIQYVSRQTEVREQTFPLKRTGQ